MTDTEEGSGRLLDENGRIFGLVNVVDALVVLLVLAVIVAGIALLFPSAGEPDTRYVTLDMGEQPGYIAEQVSPGDEWDPEGTSDALTITDVYRYNTEEGTAVIVRAEVNGTLFEPEGSDEGPTFEFRNEPIRLGQTLVLLTQEYEAEADITRIDRGGESLPVSNSEFILETTIAPETGASIDVGDEFTAGGDVFAEITELEVYPSNNGQYALIGISATTLESGNVQRLGNTRVSVGSQLSLAGDGYDIEGDILRRGTLEEFGTETTRTVTLKLDNIPPERADTLSEGLTEQMRGQTTAEVQNVSTQPAEVVLESEDGNIYLREHPRNKDVELTVDLSVRQLDDGTVRFRGGALQTGQTVLLDLNTVTVEGEVIELEG